jgi:hypothetical protein
MLILMALAILGSVWHHLREPRIAAVPRAAGGIKSGDEIVAVFIGGSFCGGSRMPGLREAVERANRDLRARALVEGTRFASVGVALDWSVSDGAKFLAEFGPFDELVIGRNWLNTAVIKYVWRDIPGQAAVPQMVVVRRHVDSDASGIVVSNERLLTRKLGADEIIEWAHTRSVL